MFTCKPEHRVGVYMITSTRTGDTYVGSSSNLPQRFSLFESCIKNGFGYTPATNALWIAAFQKVEDAEYRILEFVDVEVVSVACHSHRGGISRKSRRQLLNREYFWIYKLNPTLNKRDKDCARRIEDLPTGAPDDSTAVKAK